MLVKTSYSAFASAALLTASLGFADASQFEGRAVKGSGEYNQYGKNATTHRIELKGDGTGKYCPGSGKCGELWDIAFDNPEADIVGKWKLNGTQGTFQWNFFDSNNFEGGFRYNQAMKPSEETGSLYTPYDGVWKGQLN